MHLFKTRLAGFQKLKMFAALVAVFSAIHSTAMASEASFQLSLQSVTVSSGSQPAIKVAVINNTGAPIAMGIWPLLRVTASGKTTPYPVVERLHPWEQLSVAANATGYMFGSASSWLTLTTFRDFFQPGSYALQYCVHLDAQDGVVCSNTVSITLQ